MDATLAPPKARRRNLWIALLLSLLNPAYAMLYLGRPYRALVYLALTLLTPLLASVLASRGVWPAGVSWLAAYSVVVVVAWIETFRIVGQGPGDFVGSWYTRWYGLLACMAAVATLALTVRANFFEPFRQPSSSMMPTLRDGDQFILSKRAFASRSPERGDIVVFRLPTAPDVLYVKRVVGLPGDRVIYDAVTRRLTINGAAVPVEDLGPDPERPDLRRVRESLDGKVHLQLWHTDIAGRGGSYDVPEGHYFVLGDNRDNSQDSRYSNVQFVPFENIVGKVVRIWWNTEMPNRAGIVPE